MNKQNFLSKYGISKVECLANHYCDLNKGDVISGWIKVKGALANLNEVNSLDKLN